MEKKKYKLKGHESFVLREGYILTRSSINLLKHSSGQRKQQIKEILMDFTIWVSAMNMGGA